MGKAEKKKKTQEEYEQMRDKMINAGYVEKVHTIPMLKAYVVGMLIPVVIIIILGMLYWALNGGKLTIVLDYRLLLVFALITIVVHELIHGLTWSFSCEHGFRSIAFRLSGFTPLCHCKEVLSGSRYLIGTLMPFLVLGIGVAAAAFIFTNIWLLYAAAFNILSAGGDLLIVLELRKARKAKIFDHPTEAGFIAFVKND